MAVEARTLETAPVGAARLVLRLSNSAALAAFAAGLVTISDVASNAVVVPFAVMAAIGAVVLWSFLRHVDTHPKRASALTMS